MVVAGCTGGGAQAEVTVSTCDSTAHVKRGGVLVVRLESQLTAGYSWRVASQTGGLLKPRGEPEVERRSADVDGGSEQQVFRFDAPAAGSGAILFQYRRPWETEKPPMKTCLISVEIEE